jgi:hypothetical protein
MMGRTRKRSNRMPRSREKYNDTSNTLYVGVDKMIILKKSEEYNILGYFSPFSGRSLLSFLKKALLPFSGPGYKQSNEQPFSLQISQS